MICKNFMCEKLGSSCVCKFARYMEQNDFSALEELNISSNKLATLPIAMFLPTLIRLDFSNNNLTTLEIEYFARCPKLEYVDASQNVKLKREDWDDKLRATLPAVKEIVW